MTSTDSITGYRSSSTAHGHSCRCPFCSMSSSGGRPRHANSQPTGFASTGSGTVFAADPANTQTLQLPTATVNISKSPTPTAGISRTGQSVRIYDIFQGNTSAAPWPGGPERTEIAQTLVRRISAVLPYAKTITPGKVLELAHMYRPNLEQEVPVKLFDKLQEGDLSLNPANFQAVERFDQATEQEFLEDASPTELNGGSQIFRLQDGPGQHTGVKLEIVNSSGKKLSLHEVFTLLNKPINQEVRNRIWGVIAHEQLHKLLVETNPYIKVSGWYEPIKIEITPEGLKEKEDAMISTRGQADIDESLYSEVEILVEQVERQWQVFQHTMQQFQARLAYYQKRPPQERAAFIQQKLQYLGTLERGLDAAAKELGTFSYWCQNLIVSALAPILLIYNFPVHAGTLSEEDLAIAKDFNEELGKSQTEIQKIEIMKQQIQQAKAQLIQLQQGAAPRAQAA